MDYWGIFVWAIGAIVAWMILAPFAGGLQSMVSKNGA